jgi:hypothetical protein
MCAPLGRRAWPDTDGSPRRATCRSASPASRSSGHHDAADAQRFDAPTHRRLPLNRAHSIMYSDIVNTNAVDTGRPWNPIAGQFERRRSAARGATWAVTVGLKRPLAQSAGSRSSWLLLKAVPTRATRSSLRVGSPNRCTGSSFIFAPAATRSSAANCRRLSGRMASGPR